MNSTQSVATVFLDSPMNSTLFTTCCEVAILDEQACCPRCGQEICPRDHAARWRAAYGPIKRKERWYGNFRPNDKA